MISIIIPKCQDITYRIRCLNSIEHQSYKNYEIIVIGNDYTKEIIDKYKLKVINIQDNDRKWEGINEAIKNAKGDFVFFCSMTSVLASDVLQKLRDSVDEESSVILANYLLKGKNTFQENENTTFLIYGKLWKKELLQKSELAETCDISAKIFILNHLKTIEETTVQKQAYIYETDETICNYNLDGFDKELFQQLLSIYSDSIYFEKNQKMILEILDSLEDKSLQSYMVLQLTKKEDVSFEFKYKLAEDYIWKWYQECQKNKEEDLYNYVKEYLVTIEQREDFLLIVLQLLGMTKTQYANINKYNLQDWIFFKDKLIDEENLEHNWIQQLLASQKEKEKQLFILQEESLQKIDKLESKIDTYLNMKKTEPKVSVSMPEGTMLAEYVVDTYKEGKLGLKTIIKALGAWLKYKVFGNKVK